MRIIYIITLYCVALIDTEYDSLEIGLSVDEFEYYSEDGSGSLPDCGVSGKKL